jgi:hypothetical protein
MISETLSPTGNREICLPFGWRILYSSVRTDPCRLCHRKTQIQITLFRLYSHFADSERIAFTTAVCPNVLTTSEVRQSTANL